MGLIGFVRQMFRLHCKPDPVAEAAAKAAAAEAAKEAARLAYDEAHKAAQGRASRLESRGHPLNPLRAKAAGHRQRRLSEGGGMSAAAFAGMFAGILGIALLAMYALHAWGLM